MTASENRPSVRAEFVDLVASVGPEPAGVDQLTHIIASIPAKQLTGAINANILDYFDHERDLNENDGIASKYIRENPTPEISLARDLESKQYELSKTRRRVAVAATFLALFTGMAGLTDKALRDADKALAEMNPATYPMPKSELGDRIESDAIAGGIVGLAGGLMVMMVGVMKPGRPARKAAQKIVRKAEKASS